MAHGAAIAAISARETIKRTGDDGWIEETLDRSKLWMTHTPQGFERDIILDAHRSALEDNICATDDSALVERSGCRVKIVRSHPDNIKITTPEDLEIAETLLRWQREHNLPEALAIY
jgi:2-C-methyl-D-erythritol 4-phosphate cytidylyltransferase